MRLIAALAAVSLLVAGCGDGGGDEDDAVGVGGEAQEATEQEGAGSEQEGRVQGEEGGARGPSADRGNAAPRRWPVRSVAPCA